MPFHPLVTVFRPDVPEGSDLTNTHQTRDVKPVNTDVGLKQSSELAKKMDHWLNLFDRDLAAQDLPLSDRPLRALMMLFWEGAIGVKAGDERIDGHQDLSKSIEEPWFRVLFDAVEYWYVARYGAPAMEARGKAALIGTQMIRGTPFAISVPANRVVLEEEGELAWIYLEDGLGEGEDATSWIVDSPDLASLDGEARATVVAEVERTAEILRAVEFRRVTFSSDGDHEVQKLIQSTLTYLSQAATRMVSGQKPEIGLAWFDLQMANEAALKAVIRSKTGKQPHIHVLSDLLDTTEQHGVAFESSRLSSWPSFSDVSVWRYGQGNPPGAAKLYDAYQVSLELVRACLSQFTPKIKGGFGVLVRYSPWRAKNALEEYRK